MQSHIRRARVCLAVTCHLHCWRNDQDLLRDNAVTREWNGYRNKSQHRKFTLEKKSILPLQRGHEPRIFRPRTWRSTTELSRCHIHIRTNEEGREEEKREDQHRERRGRENVVRMWSDTPLYGKCIWILISAFNRVLTTTPLSGSGSVRLTERLLIASPFYGKCFWILNGAFNSVTVDNRIVGRRGVFTGWSK